MNQPNEHLERLQERLLTKEQALERIQGYEGCTEVSIAGRSQFQIHPSADNHFILEHDNNEYVFGQNGFEKLCRIVGIYLSREGF